MCITKVTLTVDGGCSRNGQEGAVAYYSMRLQNEAGEFITMTQNGKLLPTGKQVLDPFFKQTNQVAELVAWIKALDYVLDLNARCAASKHELPEITVQGDSEYVLGFITGRNKKVRANYELVDELKELARLVVRLNQVTVKHVEREEVVKVLGH